jgi:hypothetical protein
MNPLPPQATFQERRTAMTILIPFAATGLFAAGATAGIIGMVTVAIRREEKDLTLTGVAPDHVTRAGRLLTGVGVRAPRGAAADRETALAQPAAERAQGPGTCSPGTRAALRGPCVSRLAPSGPTAAQTAPGHHTRVERRLPPQRISMKHRES